MESHHVIAFPGSAIEAALADSQPDGEFDRPIDAGAGAAALVEIDAAITLVASRVARRVRLTAVPFIESAASVGLAHAHAAGMAFAFERGERIGVATVTVGPLDR